MAVLIGIAVVSAFAAMLWLSQDHTPLHLAVLSSTLVAAFLFGAFFGLSGGFLIAIGVMTVEILLIRLAIRSEDCTAR